MKSWKRGIGSESNGSLHNRWANGKVVYPETGFRRSSARHSTILDRSGTVSSITKLLPG